MRTNSKSLAYALLRIALGVNFAGHGLIRIHNGVAASAQTTAEHLAKSPLPPGLIDAFSYAIPFVEAILGLTLILGVFTRAALIIGAVFMMILTIGVPANQQWDIAGKQLLYSIVFFLLLFLPRIQPVLVGHRTPPNHRKLTTIVVQLEVRGKRSHL